MSNNKFKQSIKGKGVIQIFLIVCSLFISINVFSWGEDCCAARYMRKNKHFKENRIKIVFKFFQYGDYLVSNAFLEKLDVSYSTDGGTIYKHLLTAATKNQNNGNKAWIDLKNKRIGTRVYLFVPEYEQNRCVSSLWQDETCTRLIVDNHSQFKNQTWITLDWHIGDGQDSITHVSIKAKWHPSGILPIENHDLLFRMPRRLTQLNALNTNFSDLSFQQEIRTEDKINTVKVYKEANTIVIKGALSEKIQVYTTSGKLVESIMADNDIVKIELSVKQAFIVSIGQLRYKVLSFAPFVIKPLMKRN